MFEPLQPKFADALRENAILGSNIIKQAKLLAAETGTRFDEVLIKLGHITPSKISDVVARHLEISDLTLEHLECRNGEVSELNENYCKKNRLLLLEIGETTVLAMENPLDDSAAKLVTMKIGRVPRRMSISPILFDDTWKLLYGEGATSRPLVKNTKHTETNGGELSADDLNLIRDSKSDAPTIQYMDNLINAAALDGCSDIHVRPNEYGAEIFVRRDGVLSLKDRIESKQLHSLISRLKIVARLDVSETRLPQDGKFVQVVAGVRTDIRLATMPQMFGEGAVLRILGRQINTERFQDLGFDAAMSKEIEKLFALQEGLALVVGPTGSGKSTTLYTALNRLAKTEQNIITIEDPVEIQKPGTNQVQVDESTGLTFPRALRAALRQDPDIILIGEIRDGETASIAIQAALTGHIVLASLHTSSAISAVPRLMDMGVEPYLLSAVLKGVLAQRLVPKLCYDCKGNDTQKHICSNCNGTGLSGRQILGEIALLDETKVLEIAESNTHGKRKNSSQEYLNPCSINEQAHELFRLGVIGGDQLHWAFPNATE